MANAYHNPCDTCKEAASCKHNYGCADWQIRYRYRQKQINAYARNLITAKITEEKVFLYPHPDEIMQYLANGPCKKCRASTVCDIPCPAYLRWYNARMRFFRKKVQL